uniref:Uncharacterized protein n=1 Tax=Anthurium amnicola TaxID=1678845 RepID=A0A1D1YVL2_9ARAE
MACINMFKPDHQGLYGGGGGAAAPPPMSPRISFSNDFVLDAATGCPAVRYERPSPAAASLSSSDFEFSVESYGMMAADELFSKGRLLPLNEHCAASRMQRMTLRDELLAGEEEDDDDDDGLDGLTFSPSPSSRLSGKVALRWKTLLGLRKAHSVGKKQDKRQERQRQQQDDGEEGEEEDVASNTGSDNASCQQDTKDDGRDVEIGL